MRKAEKILKKWYNPLHGIGEIAELQIVEAMKEYAKEVAKEALKKASENADTIEIPDAYGSTIDVVDKQSVLNESNIPEL